MDNQELLEAIAPYLSYGLKCICLNNTIDRVKLNKKTFVLDAIKVKDAYHYWTSDASFVRQFNCIGKGFRRADIKLILRPLSDLTKTCLEGGKVPIIVLAEMATGKTGWSVTSNGNAILDIDNAGYHKEYYLFYYDEVAGCFNYRHNKYDKLVHVGVVNHQQLFNWMYKHHFDINGLIPKYAIDVNTINK